MAERRHGYLEKNSCHIQSPDTRSEPRASDCNVTTSVLTATLQAPPPDNHPMTYGRAVTALNMVRKFFGNVQKYNLFLKKKSLFLDFFASTLTATFPEFTELCLSPVCKPLTDICIRQQVGQTPEISVLYFACHSQQKGKHGL